MKILFTVIALLFLIIGLIGLVLPILPTTPFILLATYFFLKGSNKVNDWYLNTRFYHKYGNRKSLIQNKYKILVTVSIWLIIAIILVESLVVQIILILLILLKTLYFIFILD